MTTLEFLLSDIRYDYFVPVGHKFTLLGDRILVSFKDYKHLASGKIELSDLKDGYYTVIVEE